MLVRPRGSTCCIPYAHGYCRFPLHLQHGSSFPIGRRLGSPFRVGATGIPQYTQSSERFQAASKCKTCPIRKKKIVNDNEIRIFRYRSCPSARLLLSVIKCSQLKNLKYFSTNARIFSYLGKLVKNYKRAEVMPKNWDLHKDEIENLYIKQGHALLDVQKIIQRNHGFEASSVSPKP